MLDKDSFEKTDLWLEKHSKKKLVGKRSDKDPEIPEKLWKSCPNCKKAFLSGEIKDNMKVCPSCGYHFMISARQRLSYVADEGSWEEFDGELTSSNLLSFPKYDEKLDSARQASDENEAVICGKARVEGFETVLCIMEPSFIMGSMGSVVGEKITRAFEYATKNSLPVTVFSVSGGARMQEGILSLMQMAKTSGAVKKHSEAGLLYLSFITNPTTGGVTASFAMEGDIIVSEPEALIGFAGPRVIEQTIKQKLPKGFQSAEFLEEKGFLDGVVKRKDMKSFIGKILKAHHKKTKGQKPETNGIGEKYTFKSSKKSAYEQVKAARDKNRPTSMAYINACFRDFIELRGDRRFRDDKAVVGGIAFFDSIPCTVIGLEKGVGTTEKIQRNFGSAHPEGYRKALRLMKQAEKFKRPVICLIDTAGAFCGISAEERGQGQAIAENLTEMMGLKTPILSILVGEGGSGGALALGVANEVWMMENSVYSVISPEGCASILWKDSSKVNEAAESLKLTANDLKELGVIEKIIPFGKDKITEDNKIFNPLKFEIKEFLSKYNEISGESLAEQRYERFRKY